MNAQQIINLIQKSSVTFAGINYTTKVQTAAKFKHLDIIKNTTANVQVFGTLKEFTNVYENAVKKSSTALGYDATDFKSQENYFEHTSCYSIVKHKTTGKEYLYCIFNNAKSVYELNGQVIDKNDVIQYLTPSAAKALTSNTVTNNEHNIEHTVHVRTISIENITKFTANKQTI